MRKLECKLEDGTQYIHDHCFVLEEDPTLTSNSQTKYPLREMAKIRYNGIELSMRTTAPSFHMYSGRYNPSYKGDRHGEFSGVAFEPERYVDAVNQGESWKNCVTLKQGEKYYQETEYAISLY